MKKLLLLPFTLLIMGVLFFGCEKENSKLEEETTEQEWLSTQRSDCGHDRDECLYICTGYGACCCKIRWEYPFDPYVDSDPFPSLCVAKDTCAHPPVCIIPCDATDWPSVPYDFCPPYYPSPPYAPNTVRTTYICVPKNTALSVTNHHISKTLRIQLDCSDSPSGAPNPSTYDIDPGQTKKIEFNGCDHRSGC